MLDFGHDLEAAEISRYSRQLLLPSFGVSGQALLKSSHVVIVGAGGLGCPAALYLGGAGVGRITIVDHDVVELNNLHRQVAHAEADAVDQRRGIPIVSAPRNEHKADSLCAAVKRLNSTIECVPVHMMLSEANVFSVIRPEVSAVLDCTDNVATRYCINDACVKTGVPLISASALRWDGQLTVYNYAPTVAQNGTAGAQAGNASKNSKGNSNERGPCYRCLFPQPPPAATVTNCNEGGVLGPVPGTMGTLQALEAIKVITGIGRPLSGRLLLFDGLSMDWRTVKIRGRRADCAACGESPSLSDGLVDYRAFCGSGACDKIKPRKLLAPQDRIQCPDLCALLVDKPVCQKDDKNPTWTEYYAAINIATDQKPAEKLIKLDEAAASNEKIEPRKQWDSVVLVDVRPHHEFDICRLPGSTCIPLIELQSDQGMKKMTSILGDYELKTTTNSGDKFMSGKSDETLSSGNETQSTTVTSEKRRSADESSANGDSCEILISSNEMKMSTEASEVKKSEKLCVMICHRGNDSQLAVKAMQESVCDVSWAERVKFVDLIGGLEDWTNILDSAFPRY